ncbi:Na+/H+ antiporter subunit C [Aquicoccus sp.]|uniref:Na+/H+ antiporter subunit C n=1 Tax=Aquicoccus sp. TaxID=2055851 RepID=UPI003561E63C
MEVVVASAVGVLTASGIYLVLRLRAFPVILGLALLSYAANVFLFAAGRLAINMPPVLSKYGEASYSDPLPQALVLTAIVISFGMTAVLVMVALAAYLKAGSDAVNMGAPGTGAEDEEAGS